MTATTLLEVVHGTDSPRSHSDLFGAHVTRRPTIRTTVRRPRLVAALADSDAPPVVVLVAPAGYGKTTVLCEWSARDPRPFAWVTLDQRHDDARALLSAVARSLDIASAAARDGRVVLVLDDVHVLRSAAAREAVGAITTQLPAEVSVALASRNELPVPVARLRAQGLVTELRQADLAMTRAEAAGLLRAAGCELGRDELDALLHRTEGWPAALSLAMRSCSEIAAPGQMLARFGGRDRDVAEYLREEVLGTLSPADRRFVLRTSILEVLGGPVCDAVLDRTGSAETLARLAGANFPLVALDRSAEHYRHHRLLGDMLRMELLRVAPEEEAMLQRRAVEWHASAGDRERAMRHALAADEIQRAGDLVWDAVPGALEQGSSTGLEHWLSRFTDAQVAGHSRLALIAAGTQLAHGQGHLAEHWMGASADAGAVLALRAALGREGIGRAGRDAEQAAVLLEPDSVGQALCGLLAGAAQHLCGRPSAARARLEDAAHRAAVPAPLVHALCLSQLALLAVDESDWEGAARLSTRARAQVSRYGLARYPITALVLAVAGLVGAQRGRVDAGEDVREAGALLERVTDFAPWYELEVQIVLARAALRLTDVNAARARIAEADRLAARIAGAPVLAAWLRAVETDLEAFTRTPSSLTAAELRILHLLPTHFSFREIAERTFVSANTVKTQANAVYRKLDVRSRSEAVTRARELGLLDV